MWQPCVGKVEGSIQLLARQGRVHRVLHDIDVAYFLKHALSVHAVALLFYMAEVLGMRFLVAQTFLIGVEHDVILLDATRDVRFTADE